MQQYLNYEKNVRNKSDCTIKAIESSVSVLTDFMKKFRLRKVSPNMLRRFIDYRLTIVSRRTIASQLALLKTLFIYLERHYSWKYENVFYKITQDFVYKESSSPMPKIFNIEELVKIFDYAQKTNKTNAIIIRICLATGCRISEVVGIKPIDINPIEQTINILGKGNKYRSVLIDKKTLKFIEQYRIQTGKDVSDQPLFPQISPKTFSARFATILQKINIHTPQRGVHTLRHTAATLMLENGMPNDQVRTQLGHSDINTTLKYTHLSTKFKRAEFDNTGPMVNIDDDDL